MERSKGATDLTRLEVNGTATFGNNNTVETSNQQIKEAPPASPDDRLYIDPNTGQSIPEFLRTEYAKMMA